MSLYVYCVVSPAFEPPLSCLGLGGLPVSLHSHAALGCWVTELESRPEPSLPNIQAHHAVVLQAVSDSVTPVPVRFGQWLESAERLDRHLEEKTAHYESLLRLFAGALEFGLRVIEPGRQPAPQPQPERAESGRQYLLAVREQMRAQDADSSQIAQLRGKIHDVFNGNARAEQFEPLRTAHGLLSAAHLVGRADFASYREGAAHLRASFPRLRFLMSGPWPPYSFSA